jgi:hypothetical protein
MSDPIRDLENFSTGGTPMTPLPAAEVRRRGDRLRRRNTTLLSVAGAVAVAAVVATPLALRGGADDAGHDPGFATSSPSASVTTSTAVGGAWLAAIPEDFSLAEGLPARNEDGTDVGDLDRSRDQRIELCGTTGWSQADGLDSASVSYTAPEDTRTRSLTLYPDDTAADAALQQLQDTVAGCTSEEVGGTEQVYAPFDHPAGEASYAWTQRFRTSGQFDTGLVVHQAVRVGNALLVTSSYGEGGAGDSIDKVAEATASDADVVVRAMSLFAEQPDAATRTPDPYTSEPGTPQVEPGPSTDDGIPADFPIDAGLTTSEGDSVDGPSARAEGVPEATFCDVLAWPNGGDARLAVTAAVPEYYQGREVVRYASAAEAAAAIATLRRVVGDCPEQPQQDGSAYLTTEREADTGHDSFAFSRAYDRGLGGEGYVFTRVGTAVLALYTSGETAPENMDKVVARLVDATALITPAMCTFTDAGC